LLGLVWFFVLDASRVASPAGSIWVMLYRERRLISTPAASRFAAVNKCVLYLSSHMGWWQLKLPNQMICSFCMLLLKVRNDEWAGARPDVGSTVLLWT
jgi:hypothetical protein